MPDDPYSPDDAHERRITDRAAERQLREALNWLLADERGRRIIVHLAERCGTATLSFVAGDPLQTAFNEGRRSIGLELGEMLAKVG